MSYSLIEYDGQTYFCTECGEEFPALTEDGCCPFCGTEYTDET